MINGYYHSEVAASGLLYSFNSAFSIIPFVILMNWLYYRTNLNILVPIVFHITANLFNELFVTHPDSKVIQTGILSVLAVLLVIRVGSSFCIGLAEKVRCIGPSSMATHLSRAQVADGCAIHHRNAG